MNKTYWQSNRVLSLTFPALLAVISLVYGVLLVSSHSTALSPKDEWMYIDYLNKFPSQIVIHQGESIGQDALGMMACNGIQAYGMIGPECAGNPYEPSTFPFGGKQLAYLYTPVFFAASWVGAKVVQLGTGQDLLTSARLLGPIWFAFSSVMLFALFRKFKLNNIVSSALVLTFIASPFAWWTFSFISTDAPGIALSVMLLLTAESVIAGKRSGWWLVGLSALAVTIKASNLLGVGLALAYLIFEMWSQDRSQKFTFSTQNLFKLSGAHRGFKTFLFACLAIGVTTVSWLIYVKLSAVGPPADDGIGEPFSVLALLSQAAILLPGTIEVASDLLPHVSPEYSLAPELGWALSWVCITGVIGAAWFLPKDHQYSRLAKVIFVTSLVAAPLLSLIVWISAGDFFSMSPRYGASLLPAFLLSAGFLLKSRLAQYLLASAAIIAIVLMSLAALKS